MEQARGPSQAPRFLVASRVQTATDGPVSRHPACRRNTVYPGTVLEIHHQDMVDFQRAQLPAAGLI